MAQMILGVVLFMLVATIWEGFREFLRYWPITLAAIAFGLLMAAIQGVPRPDKKQPDTRNDARGNPTTRLKRKTREPTGNTSTVATGGKMKQAINVGLVIDEPWLSQILDGTKCWEMRSTRTTKRELIGLIRKGSGLVVGTATIESCLGPLSDVDLAANMVKHRVPIATIGKWRYAWVLRGAAPLAMAVRYHHKAGAVKFVRLDADVSAQIARTMTAGTPAAGGP